MSKQLSIRDRIAFFAKIESERAEKQGGQWNKGVSIVKDEDPPKSVSAPQLITTAGTSAPFKKIIKVTEEPAAAPKQAETIPAPKSVQTSDPAQNSNTTASTETNQNTSNAPRVFTRKINIETPTNTAQSATKVSISDAEVDKLIDQVLEKQKQKNTDEDNISITYKTPSLVTLKLNTGTGPASSPNPPVLVPMTTLMPNTAPQNNTSTPIISKNVISVAVPLVNPAPAPVLANKTVVNQKSQVESRINEFVQTLHTFERSLDKEREETRAVVGRLELVTGLLALVNNEMDSLKIGIDKLVEEHKKTANKDANFTTSLSTFQDQFWKFRHNFDVQVAKSTKELRTQDGDLLARSAAVNGPSPSPNTNTNNASPNNHNLNTNINNNVLPAPTGKSTDQKTGKMSVTPFSAFLEQIQKGVALKKAEYDTTRKEKEENMKQSSKVADSLAQLLKEAL